GRGNIGSGIHSVGSWVRQRSGGDLRELGLEGACADEDPGVDDGTSNRSDETIRSRFLGTTGRNAESPRAQGHQTWLRDVPRNLRFSFWGSQVMPGLRVWLSASQEFSGA